VHARMADVLLDRDRPLPLYIDRAPVSPVGGSMRTLVSLLLVITPLAAWADCPAPSSWRAPDATAWVGCVTDHLVDQIPGVVASILDRLDALETEMKGVTLFDGPASTIAHGHVAA
jgi:hypothetical protein